MKKIIQPIIIGVLAITVIVLVIVVINGSNTALEASDMSIEGDGTNSEGNDNDALQSDESPKGSSIAIPGFETIRFVANEKNQDVTFLNPESNDCYFIIHMILDSGEEIWTSDYIAAGDESEKVVLNKTLDAGTYKAAKIKYECFSTDGSYKQLNGAEIKVTLIVK